MKTLLLKIVFLLCLILNCNLSWAKNSIYSKLTSDEIKVFGKTTDKNLPIKTRIAKLEQAVFGKTKTGTISQRLAAINQALTNKNFQKANSQDAKTNADITSKNIPRNNSPAKSVSLCDIHLIRENPILANTTPDPNTSNTNGNTLSSAADNSNSNNNQAISTDSSLSSLAAANAPNSSANSSDSTDSSLSSLAAANAPNSSANSSDSTDSSLSSLAAANAPNSSANSSDSTDSSLSSLAAANAPNSSANSSDSTDSSLSSLAAANAPNSSANSSDRTDSKDAHLLKLGMKLYQEGKLNQAKACFKEVLFNNPNSYNAYFNLGVIAESRSDWNSALHDYQNALAIDPHNTEIRTAVQQLQSRIAGNNQINNNQSPSNFISTDSVLNQMASNNYQSAQPDYANANLPKYTPPKKFKETFWEKHPVLKKVGVRTLEIGGLALICGLPFIGFI